MAQKRLELSIITWTHAMLESSRITVQLCGGVMAFRLVKEGFYCPCCGPWSLTICLMYLLHGHDLVLTIKTTHEKVITNLMQHASP